jgi:formamidopyrimidine-DNA glycosylase
MSIELPEAHILARQLGETVVGRRVASCELREAERLRRSGFINQDAGAFDALAGRDLRSARSRGNTILVGFEGGLNLLVAPEYGGVMLLHGAGVGSGERFHLKVAFDGGSALTVRLTGMGAIQVLPDARLGESYMYRRDFLGAADPLDERSLPEGELAERLRARGRMLKAVLVGKEAVVVGISNAAFQEIAWQARLHPKRKASSLTAAEGRRLARAVKKVLADRIRLGGKEGFVDLFGKPGRYSSAMGGKKCPRCGAAFARVAVGGGPSTFCPDCQPAP